MKIWRDREGRWIDANEFRQRFAKGLEGVTPIQQKKSQIFFSWLTVVGIVCGLIVCLFNLRNLWWLGIILFAGLGNTLVGLLGIWQQYKSLKRIEDLVKGGQENEE